MPTTLTRALRDAMTLGFPPATPGQAIGLLGGSFDPPHIGHLHATRQALRRVGLDRVWWLVTPGNPLKADAPADLARRIAAARTLVDDPRVVVTGLEAALRTRYTADTLRALRRRYPSVRFVWLMGADNLAGFHRWDDWDWIARTVPIAVLPRPGALLRAGLSPAAMRFQRARLRPEAAPLLPRRAAPAWSLLTGPMVRMSSTALRQAGVWAR